MLLNEIETDTNEKQKERATTTRASYKTQSSELFKKYVEMRPLPRARTTLSAMMQRLGICRIQA